MELRQKNGTEAEKWNGSSSGERPEDNWFQECSQRLECRKKLVEINAGEKKKSV